MRVTSAIPAVLLLCAGSVFSQQITVDGNASDWAGTTPVINGPDIRVSATNDAANVYLLFEILRTPSGFPADIRATTFYAFVDADLDPGTGCPVSASSAGRSLTLMMPGADYNIGVSVAASPYTGIYSRCDNKTTGAAFRVAGQDRWIEASVPVTLFPKRTFDLMVGYPFETPVARYSFTGQPPSGGTPTPAQTACNIPVGQGTNGSEMSAFQTAYNRAGGQAALGCPTAGVQDGFTSYQGTRGHFQTFAAGSINYHVNNSRSGQAFLVPEPLYTKWKSLGMDASNPLGFPISDLFALSTASTGTQLRYQGFEGGALELHMSGARTGQVFEVHGAIYTKWGLKGYASWVGGMPVTDEFDAPRSPQGTTGRVSRFENGHIFWRSGAAAAYETHGAINALYAGMGSSGSWLGFPTSDEYVNSSGRAQSNFENGYITTLDGVNYEASAFACTYSLASTTGSFAPAGGTGSIRVSAPSGCSWTASTSAAWLALTSDPFGSGSGTLGYSVAANPGTAVRTATLTIAGQTLTITQTGSGYDPAAEREIWIYGADGSRTLQTQPTIALQDFVIVVERWRKSPEKPTFEYHFTVLGENLIELESAVLVVVRDHGVNLIPGSTMVLRNVNIPGGGIRNNMVANKDSGWEDLTVETPWIEASDSILRVAKDVVGFIPWISKSWIGKYASAAVSLKDLFSDLGELMSQGEGVSPSSAFSLKVQDVNARHTDRLAALRLRPSFVLDLVYGVRFVCMIDESAVLPRSDTDGPWFFLKAKNRHGTYIGLELSGAPAVVTRR